MITFKDMVETKKEVKDAWKFREKIITTEASFDFMQTINVKTAAQINHLFGRFFNQPKKAVAHTWERKNNYNNMPRKIELQLSKAGIGATDEGDRIRVYDCLIEEKENYLGAKGLVQDVIKDNDVYDKLFKTLSPKGQDVLKALKESVEVTNIENPKATEFTYPLNISDEEKEIFGLKKDVLDLSNNKTYILLEDVGKEIHVEVKSEKKKEENQYTYDRGVVFKVNSLDIKNEKDFPYLLFMHYHLPEFQAAFDKYIEVTKEHKERWAKFKELMNSKIAKYVILYKM